MEIERKWLLERVPEVVLWNAKKDLIESGYITLEPQVRFSRKTSNDVKSHKMTIKSGTSLSRPEVESPVGENTFNEIVSQFITGGLLNKTHYTLEGFSDFPIEVSIVDEGRPSSFIYAEIEYPTEEDALISEIPDWLKNAKEVTGDPYYYMANYFFRNYHNI